MSEKSDKTNQGKELFKSVFIAYFIIIFHILLLVGVGCLIIFFRGVINYMTWILVGFCFTAIALGLYFVKRMGEEKKNLSEMVNSPMFGGRSVEISLMGGMASIKLGQPVENSNPALPPGGGGAGPLQLEDPASARIRQLSELAGLLENDLITLEEYNETKKQLFNS